MLVYRLTQKTSTTRTLAHRNAANVAGLISFATNRDDEGFLGLNKIQIYRVTVDGDFNEYEALRGGNGGTGVGRRTENDATQYSFGTDGYTEELVGEMDVNEMERVAADNEISVHGFAPGTVSHHPGLFGSVELTALIEATTKEMI